MGMQNAEFWKTERVTGENRAVNMWLVELHITELRTLNVILLPPDQVKLGVYYIQTIY